MTRLEWILGSLLSIMLLAAAVLFLWPRLQARPAASGPPAAAVMVQPTSTFQGQTAQAAYAAAETAARDWAADARLIQAMATWPESSEIQSGAATWTFTFYSPEQSATALLSVIEGEATVVSQRGQVGEVATPIDVGTWQMDSPAVVARLLEAGGATFLESEGQATLILTLTAGEQPEWEAVLFAREPGRSFSMRLDAQRGELIDVDETSG